MSVKITRRPLKNDRVSLNLYLYKKGKEQTENLKLFVYLKPKNKFEKQHNSSTEELAEKIKSLRIQEMQDERFNMHTGFKSQGSFIQYFKELTKQRIGNAGNYGNWASALKHLVNFSNGKDLKFSECDEYFLNGFRDYLLKANITKSNTRISQNSAASYLNKIKAALHQAIFDRIIIESPTKWVKSIKLIDNRREYLLHEEVKILANTPCESELLKRAFLFSCLTGLRWSDIQKLTWKEVFYSEKENQWKIHFTQKKTKDYLYHPISEEALEIIGERGKDDDRVFKGLVYTSWNNHTLDKWAYRDAGINKKITFHCARHTYATMLLTAGVDIYVVSKLMGHKDIRTTQIYARIIDARKNESIDLIPSIW